MRLIGKFLIVCLVLAALRAVALVIALAIIAAIVVSMIVQPKQTLGCMVILVFLSILGSYPVPAILLATALVVFGILEQRRRRR